MAGQSADPKVKARVVLLYVKDMVTDYLSNGKVQFGVVDATGKKGKDIPKEVWEEGLNQLCHDIADEVLVKIAEIWHSPRYSPNCSSLILPSLTNFSKYLKHAV